MKIKNAEYFVTAVYEYQFPKTTLPEVVFAGRSNVGKSSLINMLVARKKLAYFSSKPGKTQTLNFYKLDEKLMFVDVPGYGYAKVSFAQREAFGKMITNYLELREQCKAVCLLVDARHKPSKEDVQMYEFLSFYGIPTIILATKADKISKNKYPAHTKMIREGLGIPKGSDIPIVMTSGETSLGKTEAWSVILKAAGVTK